MERVDRLVVSLDWGIETVEVGELALVGREIFFKYYPKFIDLNIEISPFKMKLSEQELNAGPEPFEGLFGVFDDSLPDGWGRLLLDRSLIEKGELLSNITPLDRLAYVGNHGMGALTYQPKMELDGQRQYDLELDQIASEMNLVLEGASSDLIDELHGLGGSSGGARPKIFAGYNPETDHIIYGKHVLPPGYEHWIIKFASTTDLADIANVEFAYYKMALDCGINMSSSRLFEGKSGKKYFGTKRFDRVGEKKLHMHSAAGLMHDNFRLSNLDYGHLMDCAFKLEKDVRAYEKVLRLAAFNVFAHNRDDHSKNFTFLMDMSGNWKFAPAYDLTYSSSSHGMHSTTVAGEGKSPGKANLLELAKDFSVKKPERILEQVQDTLLSWKMFAKNCGVSGRSERLIENTLVQ